MTHSIIKKNSSIMLKLCCFAFLLIAGILMIFLVVNSSNSDTDMMQLLSSDIGYSILYMVAMIYIFCFLQLVYIMKQFSKENYQIESVVYLYIITIVQLLLCNFVVASFLGYYIFRNVDFKNYSLKVQFKSLKDQKSLTKVLIGMVIYVFCISTLYATIFSITKFL